MPQNFLGCDRDQELLLPPSLREWLPEEHLAWFVLEAVDELDLAAFYADYRLDGHGRAAHEPAMMVALLVYAYATGVRTSRNIERHCHDDVAFRVITANQAPDHATVARFRVRHETAIGGLFGSVLELCARAGMVELYPDVVDGVENEGGVPSRLIKTDAGVGRQEGTPWWMFAGSPSGRPTGPASRWMISRARARAG